MLKKFFLAVYVWTYVSVTLFLIFIPYFILWIITFWFDKKKIAIQKFTQWWNTFYIYSFPFWRVNIIGKEKLRRDMAGVAISNHCSLLDIVFLFHTFAYFNWVSKIENFRVPVLGWVMYLNGYIKLKREDPRTFPKMFEGIKEALKNNQLVMIFPEGTRSKSGQVGRFKEGAFKAAIENKVPIIPIVLDGTDRILPKDDFVIHKKTLITIKILDPVPYEKFPSYDPAILKEYFRNIILEELNTIRNNNK